MSDSINLTDKDKTDVKIYRLCTNCIHITIGTNRRNSLKCSKRKCKITDKTEATWCRFYEEENSHV